jgi:hypothetical protein
MIPLRCCLFAWCIVLVAGALAQDRATPLPNSPEAQKPGQPSLDGRKVRLALISQISSKSPSGCVVHGEA